MIHVNASTTALHVCAFAYMFTGKERDTESGLDYFGARYYASSMGRWMSPDGSSIPVGVPYASIGDPQSLNLYAYVGNNPLSHRDLDGHHQECAPDTSSTGKDGSITSKWLHAFNDWLGTKRAQVGPDGSTSFLGFTSLPYGDNLSMSGVSATEDHFTGKDRDQESGNDYFGARYYSSKVGRFMSPDDQGGHLGDPQTLNKYVYARNNPLSYVDPDGHDFNLAGCGSTNTATCQNNLVGTTSTDANGKSTFTATVISNGANGLQDQAGNSYSGTVTSAGVSFTQNGSNTSYSGSWINGSADTSFTQSGGALNGFSFNFSQPNTATGQRLAGTFSYGDDMSASQAGAALEKAGFSHSYFDAIFNPIHGYDVTHYRGGGDPNTGKGAAHFILDDPYKVDDGFVMGPVRAGDFHFGETDPRGAGRLYDHVVHEVIPSLLTPH